MYQEFLKVKDSKVLLRDGMQHRGPMTHGSKFHRAVGSMGASSDPSRTFKNKICQDIWVMLIQQY